MRLSDVVGEAVTPGTELTAAAGAGRQFRGLSPFTSSGFCAFLLLPGLPAGSPSPVPFLPSFMHGWADPGEFQAPLRSWDSTSYFIFPGVRLLPRSLIWGQNCLDSASEPAPSHFSTWSSDLMKAGRGQQQRTRWRCSDRVVGSRGEGEVGRESGFYGEDRWPVLLCTPAFPVDFLVVFFGNTQNERPVIEGNFQHT